MRGAPLPTLAILIALSACVPDPDLSPTTTAPPAVAAVPAAPPVAPAATAPPAAAPEAPPVAALPYYTRPEASRPCDGAEPYRQTGRAHFYAGRFHGRRTASGERFDMRAMTAAHNGLPFGARAKVTNLANNQTVVVRITDRHAEWSSKAIDLSHAAAERLGFRGQGIATVAIEAVCGPTPVVTEAATGPVPTKPSPTRAGARQRAPTKAAVVRRAAAPKVDPAVLQASGQAKPRATSPTTRARTLKALPGR